MWQRDLEMAYDKGVRKGLAIKAWMVEHEEHLIRAGYALTGVVGGAFVTYILMRRNRK